MTWLTDFESFGAVNLVNDVFIETGTFQGTTLAHAQNAGFKDLHSIEIHKPYYEAARARFAVNPRIHLHLGSSPVVLREIIDPTRETTFWLDAHSESGSRYAPEYDERYGPCPLLDELDVIMRQPWLVPPLVLIDDRNLFPEKIGDRKYRAHGFPSLPEIQDMLPGHWLLTTCGDVLIATVQTSETLENPVTAIDRR